MLNIIKISKSSWFFLILFALCTNQSHANTGISGNKLFINICYNFSTKIDSVIPKDSLRTKTDSLISKKDSSQNSDALNAPISYSAADSISFQVDSQEVHLYKDAKIRFEKTLLNAGYVKLNWGTNLVYAQSQKDSAGKETGRPEFDDNGQKFRSGTIKYNFKSKKGKITEVKTQEGEGYIHGNKVLKDPDDNFYIKQGLYTTCNLDTPHFQIAASKLKIIKNDKIVTGPAILVIENITTPLFIPFGFFPNKKGQNSGIIIPTVGESTSYGFSLENGGYFFALSEKANLTIQGDIYSKGNYSIRAHSQYYNRYKYRGDLSLFYSIVKNGYREIQSSYSESSNKFIRWTHNQDPKSNPYSRFSASVNAGSNNTFRQSINSSSTDYLTNTFQSSISYNKSWPGKPYNFLVNLGHSQNTQTKAVSLTLPELAFSINRFNPLKRKEKIGPDLWYEKISTSYTGNAKNTITTTDSLLFREKTISQFSNGVQHIIPISTSFNVMKYFVLSPSINYSEKWYRQYSQHYWNGSDVVTDTIKGFKAAREFYASVSMQTALYGMYQFKKGKIQAIRHVMRPNIGYTAKPDFSKPFWGNYETVQNNVSGKTSKYSIFDRSIYGGPSQGTQSSVSYSLDNNLEMKVRQITDTGVTSKKIQILQSLSASSAYNFAADSLKMRDINVSARTLLFNKVNVQLNSNFSPYSQNKLYQVYNKYYFEEKGKLARFTSANLALGTSLNPEAFKKVKNKDSNTENSGMPVNKQTEEELRYIQQHPEEYIDFNVPWNLSINYNLQLNKVLGVINTDSTAITQTLGFNGDFSLTPQWKVTFGSGYDFKARDFTYSNIGIYRDLHCWEMRFNWIPFGFRQSFNFQINVKSSVLQDLKLTRRNPPAVVR